MPCDIHSPGGVDPWSDAKAYVIARHLRSAVSDFHQRFESERIRLWQVEEPERDDRAVLTGEIHHVCNGSDGGDLEERWNFMLELMLTEQRMSELERDAHAR